MKWSTTHLLRIPTNNNELRMHWTERASVTAGLRGDFRMLTMEHGNNAPRWTDPVMVTFQAEYRKGPIPDTDAPYLAAKAALDGIVEGKVLPNDTGYWVRRIVHEAPRITDRDALTITLETWSDE